MLIITLKANKWYRLLKRTGKDFDNRWNKYLIFRTEEFGNDLLNTYKTKKQVLNVFNRATNQAEEYEIELEKIFSY